jgi:hypothetical protein
VLDMTQTHTAAPPSDWRSSLQRGDVVLFRFPCAEPNPPEPPKRRTCLVLEVEERAGRRFAENAYGTTAETAANVGDDIHVSAPEEIEHAGVNRPTRFVCSRRITVPLDHPGWDLNPKHPSPVLGRLLPKGIARMNAIRAKIHALRHIAADRRATRRREFTVEHRRRRTVSRPGKAVRG